MEVATGQESTKNNIEDLLVLLSTVFNNIFSKIDVQKWGILQIVFFYQKNGFDDQID